MCIKLKIQYFGPIKEGYQHNDGYTDVRKVTVVTGPQASGKSCIAKLFSSFTWLEKALIRGDVKPQYVTQYRRFITKYCGYHGLTNYFKDNTYLDYIGTAYRMTYEDGRLTIALQDSKNLYTRPKVMYIPAERNMISVLENAENVKNLPESLNTLLARYLTACKKMTDTVKLPLEHTTFRYDKLNKIAWVDNEEKVLHLSQTSSGIQLLTPLYIVLDYLSRHLNDKTTGKSVKEQQTIDKRVEELLMDPKLTTEMRKALLAQVTDQTNKRLVCVIEEPEQNLYPTSQRNILNSLLRINAAEGNMMMMTTHSPFIINYLALVVKASQVYDKRETINTEQLNSIVPLDSMTRGEDISVYELTSEGSIRDISIQNGVLSDANMLNTYLRESNELFNELLDIEEGM